MVQRERNCWLCGRNGTADPLDKHHIFGGAYRKKSEKYGLCVDLCHHDCHIFGEGAAHRRGHGEKRGRGYELALILPPDTHPGKSRTPIFRRPPCPGESKTSRESIERLLRRKGVTPRALDTFGGIIEL